MSRCKERLLRAGQVAMRLGVSPTRVNQLRQCGVLEGLETPLGYLFTETQVERLERTRVKGRDTRGHRHGESSCRVQHTEKSS